MTSLLCQFENKSTELSNRNILFENLEEEKLRYEAQCKELVKAQQEKEVEYQSQIENFISIVSALEEQKKELE
ncbi:hypothetical protein SK128_002893 [Halocaridina rubra]|uniref:Uncharacterized protein n=1 Tax=Halocaridina rubra TaxID=373956 RepID=A0AAN9A2Y8_HALRR